MTPAKRPDGKATAVTNPAAWNAAALLNPKGTKTEAKLPSPQLATASDKIESRAPMQVEFQFASLRNPSDSNDFSDELGSLNVNGASGDPEADNFSNTNDRDNHGFTNLNDTSGSNDFAILESDLPMTSGFRNANSISDGNGPLNPSSVSSTNEPSNINGFLNANGARSANDSSMENDLLDTDTFPYTKNTSNTNAFSNTNGYLNNNSFSNANLSMTANHLWQLPDPANPTAFSSNMPTSNEYPIAPGFTRSSQGFPMGGGFSSADSPIIASRPASSGYSHVSTPSASPALAFSDGAMSSMIERTHNVQDRSLVPTAKRRRIDDDDAPRTRFHGSSNGILSGHVKQKQNEGQASSTGTRTPPIFAEIDLTGGDDDDERAQDPNEQEVCFGMIAGAQVKCHIVPSPRPGATASTTGSWPLVKLNLKRIDGDKSNTINAFDHTKTLVGKLDEKVSKVLAPLLDARAMSLRMDAMIGTRRRLPGEEAGQATSRSYALQLMLYGKFRNHRTVGRLFSQNGLKLLSPTRVDKGIRYFNPLPKENRPHVVPRSYEPPAPPPVQRTEEELRADISTLFDRLQQNDQLPECEPDDRIMTPLLHHQKQGLHFMRDRENTTEMRDQLWKEKTDARGQVAYHNVITGQRSYEAPTKALGGILADMMGLGKTLSVLSLISSTSTESHAWARAEPGRPQPQGQKKEDNFQPPKQKALPLTSVKKNSKATLLVCPLSTITNWEEQIKQHVRPGSLPYYIYHGPNRIKDLNELAKYDVVITTYGSISSELGARSANKRGPHPLEEIGWFRIVLDEAHMIREQSTLQFKAICRLHARCRWAVTGTPVQNKLEDLGALLAFLRIKPFHDRVMFNQFIVAPFKVCDEGIIPKLRVLVDTITIRRMKDKIDLPPRHDLTIKLQFAKEERWMYDAFQKDAQLRVNVMAGDADRIVGGKTYIHVLQAILRLRLFCSGGKDLMTEADLRLLEGVSSQAPIALDSDDEEEMKPVLTENKAYDIFNLMKDTNGDNCITCNQKLGSKEGAEIESERQEEILGHMTDCFHLICTSCIKTSPAFCPCGSPVRSTVALRSTRAGQEPEAYAEESGGKVTKGKGVKDYSGPNTKVRYLISELKKWKQQGLDKPHEPPYKSVVFSQWTTNLELIQMAMENEGIVFTRLDGKMTRNARTRAMDGFRDDPAVQVILVSIMAGGLGLNLTTGNSVYIMEPLFNPAAEAQAIDRVHRLGQKREVHCVRLLMEDSFEEKMRELQEKKMKLASLSMDREKGDGGGGRFTKTEAAKQKLMDLRSLFEKGGKL